MGSIEQYATTKLMTLSPGTMNLEAIEDRTHGSFLPLFWDGVPPTSSTATQLCLAGARVNNIEQLFSCHDNTLN
jgi:hypothetical protein